MQNIANAKYGMDNFNFFLRTTGGNGYIAILNILAISVGHMFFFKMIFTDRIAEYNTQVATWLPYVIGFTISIIISTSTYFSIVNGYKEVAKVLFWINIILSVSAYAMMLLTEIPSFEKINKEGVSSFYFGTGELKFIFKCFAVLAMAVTPDFIVIKIAEKMQEKYKDDAYMNALEISFATHQEKRIEQELDEAAKSLSSNEDEELKRMQAMMKALGRKQQRVHPN